MLLFLQYDYDYRLLLIQELCLLYAPLGDTCCFNEELIMMMRNEEDTITIILSSSQKVVGNQMAFQALCMPGAHWKTHVERMGKSARYSKSSRFRPRAKRKLKILKEEEDEDDQGKNKYVVYKDKCVICMVIAAFLAIMVIHKKHAMDNPQSLPQLVGQMNHIVDALDAQAGTDLITKKQHRPGAKTTLQKTGSDAWQLWNVTYNNGVKLSAHSYLTGYEPSNIFAQDMSKFYVGLGYPVVLNFEFDITPIENCKSKIQATGYFSVRRMVYRHGACLMSVMLGHPSSLKGRSGGMAILV